MKLTFKFKFKLYLICQQSILNEIQGSFVHNDTQYFVKYQTLLVYNTVTKYDDKKDTLVMCKSLHTLKK